MVHSVVSAPYAFIQSELVWIVVYTMYGYALLKHQAHSLLRNACLIVSSDAFSPYDSVDTK